MNRKLQFLKNENKVLYLERAPTAVAQTEPYESLIQQIEPDSTSVEADSPTPDFCYSDTGSQEDLKDILAQINDLTCTEIAVKTKWGSNG